MKFKIDKNFGRRTPHLFQAAGHYGKTTADENMRGCADRRLYEGCCAEQRCLVTLDLDLSDVALFPPVSSGGIAGMRIPRNPTPALLEQSISLFLLMLTEMCIEKNLRIVETTRIRFHQSENDEEGKAEEGSCMLKPFLISYDFQIS